MLYQTISTLQFHFSNGFGNKRNLVCSQMNRKNIITIRISFKRHMSIYIFKKKCCYFSCIEAHNHQTSGLTTSGFRDKMKIYRPSRRLFTLFIFTDYFITSFVFKLLHIFFFDFSPIFYLHNFTNADVNLYSDAPRIQIFDTHIKTNLCYTHKHATLHVFFRWLCMRVSGTIAIAWKLSENMHAISLPLPLRGSCPRTCTQSHSAIPSSTRANCLFQSSISIPVTNAFIIRTFISS